MSYDPPKWEIFDKHGPYVEGRKFGIFTTVDHVNRFKARYRAAKALAGLELKDFSAITSPGYLALTRMLYAYSAFELLLCVIGVKQKNSDRLLAKYPIDDWVQELKKADTNDTIYNFVLAHGNLNDKHKHHVSQYLASRKPFNFTFLASAIRHTFAHGHLTPGAGKATSRQVEAICDVLVRALFQIIDAEFEERMNVLQKAVT
ncbi:MAG: hypothetical protein HY272_12500 [Gammaproteobacteria bacterium]|nr:hypothetical protein [Gammaproteobacteria bacterium]